jgi:GxxExxY protein
MDEDGRRLELNRVSEKIIGCAFKVSNTLGVVFLERVYENALVHELEKAGLGVEQQKPLQVFYDGVLVGQFYADLLVEEAMIVELKAVTSFRYKTLCPVHELPQSNRSQPRLTHQFCQFKSGGQTYRPKLLTPFHPFAFIRVHLRLHPLSKLSFRFQSCRRKATKSVLDT